MDQGVFMCIADLIAATGGLKNEISSCIIEEKSYLNKLEIGSGEREK